jgi:hypothetical protein
MLFEFLPRVVEAGVPVTLVREGDDIVGPVPEIAFKGLQNSKVEIVDRLFDEAIMLGLTG